MKKLFKAVYGNKAAKLAEEQLKSLSDEQKEEIMVNCCDAFSKHIKLTGLTQEQQLEIARSMAARAKEVFTNKDIDKDLQELEQELKLSMPFVN